MHGFDDDTDALGEAVLRYAAERLRLDPVPLDGPRSKEELDAVAGETITPDGMGGLAALKLFEEELAPACLSTDHPRYLSFIPCAPTEAAVMFDLVVGASSIYGGSWLEGAGAVYAENAGAALGRRPGRPAPVGRRGLRARRHGRQPVGPRRPPAPWRGSGTPRPAGAAPRPTKVAAPGQRALLDRVRLRGHGRRVRRRRGRRPPAAVRCRPCARSLEADGPDTFFAVVATSGTTNFGIVDDLASVAEVCRSTASGSTSTARTAVPASPRPRCATCYAGIEHADSFIVDPHKWLFAPFDCCALLYREPALARAAHTQKASYLDVLTDAPDWNPTDYAVGLTRRARGLPFWFSLATHGTRAYTEAVERTLEVTRFAEAEIAPARPTSRRCATRTCRSSCSAGWGGRRRTTRRGRDRLLGRGVRIRRADLARGRDGDPLRDRQPEHHRGRTSPPSSTPWPDAPVRAVGPAAGLWDAGGGPCDGWRASSCHARAAEDIEPEGPDATAAADREARTERHA